ncbi:uncharacterized protein [Henckelia pumila]|uniref:uncharacterized protein n=1 Tax=Henckelia pumila TaxID=405737 RepID=UPI003C6E4D82
MADQNLVNPELEQLIAQVVQRALAERDGVNPIPPDQNAHLEEIKRLKEEMESLKKKQVMYLATTTRNIHFTLEILEAEPPNHFKLTHIGEYDGKGDPEEHLARFKNAALLHKYSDPIKYRVFLTTIVGPAQQWFNLLRPGLFAIKKREHENLRAYIRRFSALALEVPMATTDLLINAFMQGLDTKDFLKSLIKRPPETYGELLARAEKYVNMEEIQAARASEKKERPKSSKINRFPNNNPKTEKSSRPALLGQFTFFTPLCMSKTQALQICDYQRLTQRHSWTEQGPQNRESDKYCHFHKEYGRTTKDCHHLEQEIERIIQKSLK